MSGHGVWNASTGCNLPYGPINHFWGDVKQVVQCWSRPAVFTTLQLSGEYTLTVTYQSRNTLSTEETAIKLKQGRVHFNYIYSHCILFWNHENIDPFLAYIGRTSWARAGREGGRRRKVEEGGGGKQARSQGRAGEPTNPVPPSLESEECVTAKEAVCVWGGFACW